MRPSEAVAKNIDAMREILSRYPVENPHLFGSAAWGDDTEESDLDLLVDARRGLSYFDLAKLAIELERALGVKVDVGIASSMKAHLRERAAADIRPL